MNDRDRTLVADLCSRDIELKRLVDEHDEIEQKLDSLGKLVYLTPEESVEQRNLKKRKLAGRDRIEQILDEHR
jgi:uncharacterized protein